MCIVSAVTTVPVEIVYDDMDRELTLNDPDFGDIEIDFHDRMARSYWMHGKAAQVHVDRVDRELKALVANYQPNGHDQIQFAASEQNGRAKIVVTVYGNLDETNLTAEQITQVARAAYDIVKTI